MRIKSIFLDLDNTLLPIDEKAFYRLYFGGMGQYFSQFGIQADALLNAVMKGTDAMRSNQSINTNEVVFWKTFDQFLPNQHPLFKDHIQAFYREYFPKVQVASKRDVRALQLIQKLQQHNLRLFLATNPLFPSMATHQRVAWAGLSVDMFEKITTMENAYRCKPNPDYFQQLLDEFALSPSETLMIGNDWIEDTAAEKVGIQTFIVSDNAMKEKPNDVKATLLSLDALLNVIDTIIG